MYNIHLGIFYMQVILVDESLNGANTKLDLWKYMLENKILD